jgi:hypothetical protein
MAKKKESKGFGIAGLILGICGLIGAWIPVLNVFAVPLGVLALIFGIIALVMTTSKGLAIASTILGGLTIIAFVLSYFVLFAAVDTAVNELNTEVDWTELNRMMEEYDYNY